MSDKDKKSLTSEPIIVEGSEKPNLDKLGRAYATGRRKTYAHVAICVKSKFGSSYKDLPDNDFEKVVEYIDFLKKNPS